MVRHASFPFISAITLFQHRILAEETLFPFHRQEQLFPRARNSCCLWNCCNRYWCHVTAVTQSSTSDWRKAQWQFYPSVLTFLRCAVSIQSSEHSHTLSSWVFQGTPQNFHGVGVQRAVLGRIHDTVSFMLGASNALR